MSSRAAWATLPQKAEESASVCTGTFSKFAFEANGEAGRAPEDRRLGTDTGNTPIILATRLPFLVRSEETTGHVALTHIQWLLLLKWLHLGKKACGVFVETESDFVAKANLKLVIFLVLPPLFWGGTSASPCPSSHKWCCKYNCYRS